MLRNFASVLVFYVTSNRQWNAINHYFLVVDNCASEPCQHGLLCNNGIAYYSCACAQGYTGPTCGTGDQCC